MALNRFFLYLAVGLFPIIASAQVDVYVLERSSRAIQTGPDTVVLIGDNPSNQNDKNYTFWASIIPSDSPTITGATISGPAWQSAQDLPYNLDDSEYTLELQFETVEELNAAIPAGTYTFGGTENTLGVISEDVILGAYSQLTSLKVTNYSELQSFDPTQPVTISWESFTEGLGTVYQVNYGFDGIINVEISCNTEFGWNQVFHSDDTTPPEEFGISPEDTSINIPANTLTGSLDGNYYLNIFFIRVDSAGAAAKPDGALVVGITGYELEMTIRDKNINPWLDYIQLQDGWIDTGSWMGMMNVSDAPWIYPINWGKYIYIPNEAVGDNGAWVFVPKP